MVHRTEAQPGKKKRRFGAENQFSRRFAQKLL
jgi:hypothetical protein